MTYDVAVWVGETPKSDGDALAEFERRYAAADVEVPPSPRIRAFVEAALAVYPELGDDSGDECPWGVGTAPG